jgi:hypothetical protein
MRDQRDSFPWFHEWPITAAPSGSENTDHSPAHAAVICFRAEMG